MAAVCTIPEIMCCMICFEERCDQPTGAPEEDEYGNWWTYCRKCDTWTSHPKVKE